MKKEYPVRLPKLGESIVNATVVRWFKKEGDFVHLDEPLLEVSTDKVNSEIPAPVAGLLMQIVVQVDQELAVGDLLGVIQMLDSAEESSNGFALKTSRGDVVGLGPHCSFSPAILRLAQENGVSLQELQHIQGSGADGRLSKKDFESFIQRKATQPIASNSGLDIEHVKMGSMRKAIAANMIKSFYGAPHATLITEIDVHRITQLIQKEKEDFFAKNGAKLTITSFIAKAIGSALQDHPLLNSSLDGDTIVVKKNVNLGIAVSVDQGILVPVIAQCHLKGVVQIAKEIGDLSYRARMGGVSPGETADGSITLTNFGVSGVMIGIPIIRYPEVAIIGVGAVCKRVVALDDDTFAIRSILHISLTFDHRVIDGMYGCSFLKTLKSQLERDILLS
jgi:2-oxoglutarate dehydrogenase E2 component (dihydrolipoamide succinyltransferase)